jgi:hypothetical protein
MAAFGARFETQEGRGARAERLVHVIEDRGVPSQVPLVEPE